jgi:hypothetical protein
MPLYPSSERGYLTWPCVRNVKRVGAVSLATRMAIARAHVNRLDVPDSLE